MQPQTVRALNAINRDFYQQIYNDFSQTRQQAWAGWRKLFMSLPSGWRHRLADDDLPLPPLRVLDLGCGNGRFGVFLAQSLARPIVYHGVDNNAPLLDYARDALAAFPHVEARLTLGDLVEDPAAIPNERYDLIVLFGVIHHIPGESNRAALLSACADRLRPGGRLAFASWRFMEQERYRERITPLPPALADAAEPGDHLLDWQRGAPARRYCHHVDDAEQARLIAATGLTLEREFRADGQSDDWNAYAVVRRPFPRLSLNQLLAPLDMAALFERDYAAPITLEIGFGHGAYLQALALQQPDRPVVGLEIASRSLSHVEARIERYAIPNVRVIYAMAESAMHRLFMPGSIGEVHINFPDPWFKKGHHHRRLMQADTLELIASRMVPGAPLLLATDILEYAGMSAELFAASPHFANQLPTAWVNDYPRAAVTKYERKARRDGRACYYFHVVRTDAPTRPFPILEDRPMPHIVFESPLSVEAIRARFEPLRIDDTDHIHLGAVYTGRDMLLYEAHIKEPELDQHLTFALIPRWRENAPGEYTIQLGTIGHPRPTPGVHRAIKLLADAVIAYHPDARLLNAKVQEDE